MRTLPHTIKYSFDYEEDYEFKGDGKISEIEVVGTRYRGSDLGAGHQVYYKGFQNASVEYFNTDGTDNKVELVDKNPEYFKLFKDYSISAFGGFRLKDKGASGCTSRNKCDVCEGDCDNDNDCKSGLKCFQRSSSSKQVPGCAKGGDGDIGTHDYCYKP